MAKQTSSAKPTKGAKKTNDDDFVSDDVISSGSSAYMKLEKENKIRIISKPIVGWLEWVDKVPSRYPITEEPESQDDDNPPKKFMAMAVIDRGDGFVKILELTQQSVIKAIKTLSGNPDWGNPFTYDINIEKKGEGMKTKYTVTPSPKRPLDKVAIKAANEKPCNLDNLFEGEDPWGVDGSDVTEYHLK